MGVEINKREYTNPYRPLDSNVNWLLGNTGDWQRLTVEASFGVFIEFDTTNSLFIDEPDQLTLTNGKSWNEYGFTEGDELVLSWIHRDISNPSSPVDNFNRVPYPGDQMFIGKIEDNKAFIVQPNGQPIGGIGAWSQILPVNSGEFNIVNVVIFTLKRPQGIKLTYGHLENSNSQSANLSSFIDGTLTEFVAENTDTLTIGQTIQMQPLGNQSGMSIANVNIKYIGSSFFGIKQNYEIEIVYMLSSFFEDVTNFEDRVAPSQTFDAASLTDNFLIQGFPVYNNPNVTIQNFLENTEKLGNTGWFDENYNGFDNDFTISSITYQKHEDLTQSAGTTTVTQLDYQNAIKVTAVIDGVENLSGQTKYAYGFAYIPIEETDYKQNEYPFYKNTKMNTGGDAENFQDVFNLSNAYRFTPSSAIPFARGYSSDNARMDVQWLKASISTTTPKQVILELTLVPNANFTTFFDAKDEIERNYILWVSIADQNLETNFSNRVSLLLDYNQMETFVEPVGAYDGMIIEMLDHPKDETDVASPCGTNNKIEDDLLARIFFTIDTAVSPTIPIPTALTYGFIVERDSDGLTYELETFQVDLTQYPDPTQFNFSASRGFKLAPGNNKNFIKVDYWSPLDSGTEKGVRGLYGYKIRWEDWLKRINVPAEIVQDFYDNTELNNGINNDWYQWFSNAGYTFSFVVYTNAVLNGKNVRYKNTLPIVFKDYDQNPLISTEIRYYRQSDNTLLSGGIDPITGGDLGVILDNELVRIEIEYTSLIPSSFTNLANIYALNTIEVDGGAGFLEYRQLSSIYLPEIDNPLLPLPGGTLLDVQIISPTVLLCSCLVDPNKLIDATRYKITGREGCK